MRLALLVSASLIGLVIAASPGPILPVSAKQPTPTYPIGAIKEPFAKVSGRLFNINGKVGYFTGTNAWWLGHLTKNEDVDLVMGQLVDVGYKIARVWGFGDVGTIPSTKATDPNQVWFQLLNKTGTYINYGPDGLQRLDYAISAAERHGIKFVLPFVNYWDDYGGIQVYFKAFGGDRMSWYDDARSQKAYRDYIKVLVERYKSSPAIFSWQLGNEPRCEGCDYTKLLKWIEDTSKYIKSLDPDHMVSTGEEGFFDVSDKVNNGFNIYSGAAGSSFTHQMKVPTVDYGVFHLYPSWWGYPYSWGSTWIKEHDAIGEQLNKPIILEEYGSPLPKNHTASISPWLKTIEESGIAADQLWQFGTNGTSVDPRNLGDDFTVYISDDEFTVLCKEHSAAMSAKKVLDAPRRRQRWVG